VRINIIFFLHSESIYLLLADGSTSSTLSLRSRFAKAHLPDPANPILRFPHILSAPSIIPPLGRQQACKEDAAVMQEGAP